ncbi:MAG: hypothetical protein M3O61_10845 [Gemmatimonadota bacterium]|nr:hypothetical protein [Gemmatimonadota bacterium]
METTAAGAGKTYAFVFVLAGILLIGWNYRGRHRVGELQTRLASNEFSSLLMAMLLTTVAFSALAFLPLMQHSTVTFQAELSSRGVAGAAPFILKPPNLSPPGVPSDVGDVFQMSSFFFVFIPVGIVALPLLMKRNRYRGVVEAALATTFAALAVVAGISTGLFFLPTTVAMLSAAAFAQRHPTV